jgi:hypothetical protein
VAQFVDRDDPRVLQLPGDLGLLQEPAPDLRVGGPFRAQLFQGDVARQGAVPCQPDAADAAGGVQAGDRVAVAVLGDVGGRRDQHVARDRGGQRGLHVRVGDAGERLPDVIRGGLGEPRTGVASVLAQLAFQEPVDVVPSSDVSQPRSTRRSPMGTLLRLAHRVQASINRAASRQSA